METVLWLILWRRLALPPTHREVLVDEFAATAVKTGGRPVKHARYYWLLLAESHLTRRRFKAMLGRIALLLPGAGGIER